MIRQKVPESVAAAYERLCAEGFTSRLVRNVAACGPAWTNLCHAGPPQDGRRQRPLIEVRHFASAVEDSLRHQGGSLRPRRARPGRPPACAPASVPLRRPPTPRGISQIFNAARFSDLSSDQESVITQFRGRPLLSRSTTGERNLPAPWTAFCKAI